MDDDAAHNDEEDVDVDAEGEVEGEQMTLISPITTLPAPSGVAKRYRPPPAKTFQCRGYGECRMVFSRSEHLARHIRKHTGERPFTCHCSKQFSRLDNLRQHAQTVHADRADANARMLRDFGLLHSGMVAATPVPAATPSTSTSTTKRTLPRRSRAAPTPAPAAVSKESASPPSPPIKRQPTEPVLPSAMVARQRPGTSTGYEGEMEADRREEFHSQSKTRRNAPSPPHAALGRAHSFRGDVQRSLLGGGAERSANGQSFRGHPYTRRSPPEHTPSPPSHTLNGVPTFQSSRPYSSGLGSATFQHSPTGGSFPHALPLPALRSRPSTGSGAGVRLPPLSAVVSAAAGFRPTSSGHGSGSILLPNSLTLRRPATATGDWGWGWGWGAGMYARPGTAPGKFASAVGAGAGLGGGGGGGDDSPFSFSVPEPASSSSVGSSRKRTFGGPDGPYGVDERVGSSGGYGYGYRSEYESESRPTSSRRLSVMDLLCNDDDRPTSSSPIFVRRPDSAREAEGERPTTTNGLVARALALVLDDREQRCEGDGDGDGDPFAFGVAGGGGGGGRDDLVSGG
ncbi:hypothetical protein FB45DRAFT_123344 [Roridomyces roridus]|uniref:C2H2-type domain-containing protein n=1 Tax=Roridomyces roridus TaxID=1738132 RepID=A0AAD7BIZ8_9AGAR|nr:hypothetical protein FB45DRAFT_123344 [Roridomyces roridus]